MNIFASAGAKELYALRVLTGAFLTIAMLVQTVSPLSHVLINTVYAQEATEVTEEEPVKEEADAEEPKDESDTEGEEGSNEEPSEEKLPDDQNDETLANTDNETGGTDNEPTILETTESLDNEPTRGEVDLGNDTTGPPTSLLAAPTFSLFSTAAVNEPKLVLEKVASFDGNHRITYTIDWAVKDADVDSLIITDTLPSLVDGVVGTLYDGAPAAEVTPTPALSSGDLNYNPGNPSENREIVWDLGAQTAGSRGRIVFAVEMWPGDFCDVENNVVSAEATYDAGKTVSITEESSQYPVTVVCSTPDPEPEPEPDPTPCEIDPNQEWAREVIVSNEDVEIDGGADAVELSFIHSAWTADFSGPDAGNLEGAEWIWSVDGVNDPEADESTIFLKGFSVPNDVEGAVLHIAADNSYEVYIDDVLVGGDDTEDNYTNAGEDVIGLTASHLDLLEAGDHTLKIEVKNWAQSGGTPETNPGGLLFKLILEYRCSDDEPVTPELGIEKSATFDGDENGGKITYEIVWNVIKGDFVDLVISDVIEVGHIVKGTISNGGATSTPANKIEWNLGSQSEGATGTTSVVVELGPLMIANFNCEIPNTAVIAGMSGGDSYSASSTITVATGDCGDDPLPDPCVAGPAWAEEVISQAQGDRKDGSDVLPARSNPDDALASNDSVFFSLGEAGSIVLKFEHFVEDVAGADLKFYETTNGSYPLESAQVEVSQDGSTWIVAGEVTNDGSDEIDFASTTLAWIQYVRVTDTTDFGLHANDADGYDLDAVFAVNGLCEEPADDSDDSDDNGDGDTSGGGGGSGGGGSSTNNTVTAGRARLASAPQGQVLGATDFPGLPNTGRAQEGMNVASTVAALAVALVALNYVILRREAR